MDFSESTVYERINLTNDFRPGARSARRKPGLTKGDSTESSNPFFVSDDEEDTNDEKFEQSLKGESMRNNTTKPKEDVVLPEWLLELPEDLEVGGL